MRGDRGIFHDLSLPFALLTFHTTHETLSHHDLLAPPGARCSASFQCLRGAAPYAAEMNLMNGSPGVELGVTLLFSKSYNFVSGISPSQNIY